MGSLDIERKVKRFFFSQQLRKCTKIVSFKQKSASEPIYVNKPMPSGTISNSTPSPTIPNSTDIFALNGDCMRKMCNYCSLADLYNMCVASDEFEIRILQNAVRGRTIKFSELADSCHILDVFKMFGPNITKVEIGEKDIQYKERKYSKFDEMLRLISTYCSIDTIKHLTLQYYHGSAIKKRFLYASLPFFHCIESLTIKETDQHCMEDCINYFETSTAYNLSVNDFVERVVATAVNINSLQLYNLKISGRLFYLPHICNLETLALDGCNVRVPDAFLAFVQGKPKLRSLTWNNSSLRGMDTLNSHSSNLVYELVANSITDLEALYYYPNEGFINNNNKYDGEFMFKLPDYKFLAKFRNLKVLSVPGITVGCLNVLARQNTVEKLITCFSQVNNRDNNSTDFNFLQNFSSLKCIQLFTSFDDRAKIFNKELLSKMHHLTECYLDFFQIDEKIIKMAVKSARMLSVLKISFRRGKFTVALYSKLMDVRLKQCSRRADPLAIYIEKKSLTQILLRLDETYRPDVITVHASI